MAKFAVILQEGPATAREERLGRILEFFGIPWRAVGASDLETLNAEPGECAAFGPVRAVAAALQAAPHLGSAGRRFAAFYAYLGDDRQEDEPALRSLPSLTNASLQIPPAQEHSVVVSSGLAAFAGPMSGLEVSLRLGEGDFFLGGAGAGENAGYLPIVSAGGSPVFFRCQSQGVDVFVCTSSRMIDVDAPLGRRFYDVKEHFCSVVPLVMFIRSTFPEVAWHPQELGACLIIDDPLLKPRYGFCDFPSLQALMQGHKFSTNISFIPWNWRRTSPSAAEFFRHHSDFFSVSIHGCDHTAGEFGAPSVDVLNARARLAQSRMRDHEARTGIHHDPVMVFPQGVFSSQCPEVLKRNGFLAAVNTETVPVDSQNSRTRIRDVWDVAITSYGGFPVFTRRYAFHGVENFAFDLLLGKPCLIVSHHDFFKDGGTGLLALIEKLRSMNCSLRWRSLGEVVRRACRRRACSADTEEIQMYGTELRIENLSDRAIAVRVHKKECQPDLVMQVVCGDEPLNWTADQERLEFSGRISPRREGHFKVLYRGLAGNAKMSRPLKYELSVAARRFLSELRDDYLAKSPFLTAAAAKLKGAVTG